MPAIETQPADLVYDPYDYAIDADPYPVWRRLRDEAPLYWNEEHGFYALSRFADVLAAHLDHETFSSARNTVLELIDLPFEPPPMIFMDPPEHTAMRKLVSRAFTPRRVAALESRIRELCAQYLDPYRDGTPFDYVGDFAGRLPVMVISSLLGIPEADQDQVRVWSDEMLHRELGESAPGPSALEASARLTGYFQGQVDERRANPRDDLMSDLVHAELDTPDGARPLTDAELHIFYGLLSAAGNETVARFLGWAAVSLARFPDERARLVADPGLIPNGVEEILRYEAPSPIQARTTTRDVERHGQVVPEGSKVALLNGAADRDERQFEDPDRLDVGREIDRHLAFGYGGHFCIGAGLARLEGRLALEETLARFPEWDVDEAGVELVHTSTVRGPARVPLVGSP